MTTRATVLVVEDDPHMRRLLLDELSAAGHGVLEASEGAEAMARLNGSDPVDVVVTDLVMPGMPGRVLLDEVRRWDPDIPVIITTGFGSIESAVDAMKGGAFHYLPKPFHLEQLLATLDAAIAERRVKLDMSTCRNCQAPARRGIVAESVAMRKVLSLIERVAPAETPVLLLGESGVGKDVLARLLHTDSPRSDARFVAVNCAAIPETLLESQLFGHRRGSFTDAREDRRGLFQEANGGTMFLDEIGDMPAPLQAKLLRVLQDKEVHPLGAPAPVPVDVRVVAATHRDLQRLVEEARFRMDLFYRLNVISLRIPPLRERPEDLLPLVVHFLEKHGCRYGRPGCTISPDAVAALRSHSWPGNTRELENVIERAIVLGRDAVIRLEDLPESLRRGRGECATCPGVGALADVEREHILRALDAVQGNKAAAARLLGLDRKTLYRKLQCYGLHSILSGLAVPKRHTRPKTPHNRPTA